MNNETMVKSGYVMAGFESFATFLDKFMQGRHNRWNNNFTPDNISNLISNTVSGMLHSYGQDFTNVKYYEKYNIKENKNLSICRNLGMFEGTPFIIDSGGFQISTGRLSRRESETLFIMYYKWLVEYKNAYQKAFILDIPPGPGCEIFHNFEDVYKKNLESYQHAQSLPDDIRKKIIYVHHFRTPKLWKIYTKIMRDHNMFNSFEYHATGGIVANISNDMAIPCVIYILPLIPLINEAISNGKNYLNFHILGGSNFRDIFYYELFRKTIYEKHNFTLNITYDSSGIYKQIMMGRFIYARDEQGCYKKLNLKSSHLHLKFLPNLSIENMVDRLLNSMARKWNIKEISMDGVYDIERNTFWEDIKVYLVLYSFNLFSEIQTELRNTVNRIYPIYESHNIEEFYKECLEVTRKLNQGNLTKKQRIKTVSIPKSLDILSSLDEDYCTHIINKYLSKDEFINLDQKTKLLTI